MYCRTAVRTSETNVQTVQQYEDFCFIAMRLRFSTPLPLRFEFCLRRLQWLVQYIICSGTNVFLVIEQDFVFSLNKIYKFLDCKIQVRHIANQKLFSQTQKTIRWKDDDFNLNTAAKNFHVPPFFKTVSILNKTSRVVQSSFFPDKC